MSELRERVLFCGGLGCMERFDGATPQEAAAKLSAHYGSDRATCPTEKARTVEVTKPGAYFLGADALYYVDENGRREALSHAARRTDPATSHESARRIESAKTRLEQIVLDALRTAPAGLTSHQIADKTGLSLVSVSPRLHPLMLRGAVIDTGERRAGESFRKSIVWRAL